MVCALNRSTGCQPQGDSSPRSISGWNKWPVISRVFLLYCISISAVAQEVPSSPPSSAIPEITFHASTNLVLIDVIAVKADTQRPDATLTRDDFQILDDGHLMPVKTFDTGSATRPLALWFVVQCNMKDWEAEGSGLFRGRVDLLRPALNHLDRQDTVAVAHWCDDGQSKIDLPPTPDIDHAAAMIEQVIDPITDPSSHGRPGELALQKVLQLIVDSTRSLPHDTVPVLVFLYGDFSSMPRSEADVFVNELLGSSAIAFGLRDKRSPHTHSLFGEQGAIANYFATQTGGQYFTVTPETYASGLEQILDQMHLRYELGFRPETLNGKRHKLLVKFTAPGANRHKDVRLRYRAAYIPAPDTSR
jgi:hypothetical protein